jgi:hypothetical protein
MLRFTLIADGNSDKVLIPLIKWCIRVYRPDTPIEEQFPDFRLLMHPPQSLSERIIKGIELFPCDVLFVHRDAETEPIQARKHEIADALDKAQRQNGLPIPSHVCVIPIRMQEAWMLFNIQAIRMAAGNPNGLIQLNLPPVHSLEDVPDPKQKLHELLKAASGLRGRRLKNFSPNRAAYLVSENIDDFSELRQLSAFSEFESDLRSVLDSQSYPP